MDLNNYLNNVETAASLARKMRINPVLISQWRTSLRPIPIERCVQIEQVTNGQLTRKGLRPDDWHRIWPELAQQEKNDSEKVA